MREKDINFVRSLKVKHNISKNCAITADTSLSGYRTSPPPTPSPPAAHAMVSVTGDTVVCANEKHCDLELWACGMTGGGRARKVRERQREFMSNTKHFVSGVI